MNTDKPTKTASASQNCEHVTTKYVDQCDTCGQYIAPDKRKNDPNKNWAMYNPDKANSSTIPAEKRKNYGLWVDGNQLGHKGSDAFPKYPEQSINPRFAPKASAPETRNKWNSERGMRQGYADAIDKRTIPAESNADNHKARMDAVSDKVEKQMHAEAQAQWKAEREAEKPTAANVPHSVPATPYVIEACNNYDTLKAQAAQLAEALQSIMSEFRESDNDAEHLNVWKAAKKALAAYEAAR